MKWEAVLLMILLILLGLWLVYRAGGERGDFEVQLGQTKAAVTQVEWPEEGERAFTIHYRDGTTVGPVAESTFRDLFGDEEVDRVLSGRRNAIFRLLNISTWTSLPWVVIGFGAQMVFATRFLIQWIVSERKKESVIPVAFWWVSFFGGVTLFAYFVWRQDLPAVLGQSSGIVIYARNLRLIYKKQRRDARAASRANADQDAQPDNPPQAPSGS
jgi:lipid-A-disaccharide synthase-like uncharacterized protein